MMVVDAEIEHEINEGIHRREIEEVLENTLLETKEEEIFRVSPTHPSFPEVQEQLPT